MSVRRDRLDSLVCSHDGHEAENCNGGALYFHSRCHPDVPTWARYENGVLAILCAECEAEVVAVEVASDFMTAPFQRRPS